MSVPNIDDPNVLLTARIRGYFSATGWDPSVILENLYGVIRQEVWRDLGHLGLISYLLEDGHTDPVGLGLTRDEARELVRLRHRREDDPAQASRMEKTRDAIRRALDDSVPKTPERVSGPGRGHKTPCDTRSFEQDRDYVLGRLKRDRPELAERVIEGELTAQAAAIEAGIRRRYIRVRGDSPELAVKRVVEEFGLDIVQQVVAAVAAKNAETGA